MPFKNLLWSILVRHTTYSCLSLVWLVVCLRIVFLCRLLDCCVFSLVVLLVVQRGGSAADQVNSELVNFVLREALEYHADLGSALA